VNIFKAQFGKRLREARKRVAGLTQERLAELVGVEGPSVSRWETGRDFPDDSRLAQICAAVNVSPEYFTDPTVVQANPLPDWATVLTMRFDRIESKIDEVARAKPTVEMTTDESALLGFFKASDRVGRARILDNARRWAERNDGKARGRGRRPGS